MSPQKYCALKFSAIAVTVMVVSGCGGGSSSGGNAPASTPAKIQGKVIDGYIQGATVFWDCNKNDTLDAGEIFTTTSKGGDYTLEKNPSENCRLLGLQHFDSIDADSPNTTIGLEYLMEAAPGQYALITPYTTLVAGHMRSTGLSIEKSEAEVAAKLKLGDKILIDYQVSALPNAPLLKTAAPIVVSELQKTQGGQDLIKTIGQVETELGAYFAQTGVLDLIKLNVTPFISTYQSVSERLAKAFVGNPNNRLNRTTTFEEVSANASLDAIATAVNEKNGAVHGAANWNLFTDQELMGFVSSLHKIEALKSDNTIQSEIAKLQAARAQSLSENSDKYKTPAEYDGFYGFIKGTGGYFDYITGDPEAFSSFAGDIAGNYISVGLDAATFWVPAPKLGRPNNYTLKMKELRRRLEALSSIKDATDCLKDLDEADTAKSDEVVEKTIQAISSCGAVLAGSYSEGLKAGKLKTISKNAEVALKAAGGFSEGASEQVKTLAFLKQLTSVIDFFIDFANGVSEGNPPAQKVIAGFDLAEQVLKAYTSGIELDIKSGAAYDKNTGVLLAVRQQAAAKIMRSYFVGYLDVVASSYFEVVDASIPTIQSTPQTGVVGQTIDFILSYVEQSFSSVVTQVKWFFSELGKAFIADVDKAIPYQFSTTGNQTVKAELYDKDGKKLQTVQTAYVVGTMAITTYPSAGAVVGQPFAIEMVGSNIPSTAVIGLQKGTAVASCTTTIISSDGTSIKAICTPNATGDHDLILKVAANTGVGAVIKTLRVSEAPPTTLGLLNDTGITQCSNEYSVFADCSAPNLDGWFGLNQDAEVGRDALAAKGQLSKVGSGDAGFDFTKISATSQKLPANATDWSCVQDNHTGLMWEVKTDDGGLRDKDNTYTWYNPNASTNGGYAGSENGGNNTQAFAQAVNSRTLCGHNDWRLPSKKELLSIVNYGKYAPAIDGAYFPNTAFNYYWSSSSAADNSMSVWAVHSASGGDTPAGKEQYNNYTVRLVRSSIQ